MSDKYRAVGSEAETEPGSGGLVLRNLLGITDPEEMEEAESVALVEATVRVIEAERPQNPFTAEDVRYLHRLWLGGIYGWAGEYRQVNMEKDGFTFAVAMHIPTLMQAYERNELATYTPCRPASVATHARALAVTHAELVLIHPFREGNGRCARLLALAMSLQAGYSELDFGPMDEDADAYVGAIHASLTKDYGPMESLFVRVLERSAMA